MLYIEHDEIFKYTYAYKTYLSEKSSHLVKPII